MKYYTSTWWSETALEEGDDTNERYSAYINSVRPKLSAEILRLVETVSLHDARVESIALDSDAATLSLTLNGYDYRPLSEGKRPGELHIAIRYEGVSAFAVTGAQGGWFQNSDLGYHEIEVVDRNQIEHRMLFDTGDEVVIRFRKLAVETSPRKRVAPRKSRRAIQTRP